MAGAGSGRLSWVLDSYGLGMRQPGQWVTLGSAPDQWHDLNSHVTSLGPVSSLLGISEDSVSQHSSQHSARCVPSVAVVIIITTKP